MWVAFALVSSLALAASSELNRHMQLSGLRLTFWQWFGTTLILLCALPGLWWPENAFFYFLAAVNGVVTALGSRVQLNLARNHNGRVAALIMPLKILFAFFLWLALDHVSLAAFAASPIRSGLIGGALLLIFVSIFKLRHNDTSWNAIRLMAPVGIAYATLDVFIKASMVGAPLLATAMAFTLIMAATACITALVMIFLQEKNPDLQGIMFKRKMIHAGMLMAMMGMIAFVCLICSLADAPNPAYTSAILLLTGVWLLIYHRLRGIKDDANPLAGTLLVIGAISLAIGGSM